MGKRRQRNIELCEGHGITIFGTYSWRKDMREQFRRDCANEGVEIARLNKEQTLLENSGLAHRDIDEYEYEHAMIKKEIKDAKKKQRGGLPDPNYKISGFTRK
jgi:hypothetical protein